MTKGLRITGWIIALLVLLLVAGLVAMQSPRVQTALGKYVLQSLQDKLDADISFRSTSVQPLESFSIEDLLVLDRAPMAERMDTIIYVKHLSTRFSLLGLLRKESIYVGRLLLDEGVYNLAMEPDSARPGHSQTNLERVLRVKHKEGEKARYYWGNLLRARTVEIRNIRFRMENLPQQERDRERGSTVAEGSIDWSHLDATLLNARVSHFKMVDELITMTVDDLDIQENVAGLDITNGRAKKLRIGKGLVHVEEAEGWNGPVTHLNLPTLDFRGALEYYGDFTEEIALDVVLAEGTRVSTETLGLIADGLQHTSFEAAVTGHVYGPVCNLSMENLVIRDLKNPVTFMADGWLKGLPDEDNTTLDIQVKDFNFTIAGLGGFVKDWSPKTSLNRRSLQKMAPREHFSLRGRVSGLLNVMNFTGELSSRIGGAQLDVTLGELLHTDTLPLDLDAYLKTQDLNVGRIAGISALGPVSLETGLQARLLGSGTEFQLDSLRIDRLNALDYDYSNIFAAGTYKKDAFDGRITAADPNLNFIIQGISKKSPETRNQGINLFMSLGYADLHALKIDKRERSKMSFLTTANFVRTQKRELLGTVKTTDIVLEGGSGRNEVGDITINANADDNLHRIRLDANFMEASFVGDHPLGDFADDLKALVIGKEMPALAAQQPKAFSGGQYKLHAKVGGAQQIFNFILPGLYVENGTEATLEITPRGGLQLDVQSGRLARNENYIKDLQLSFDNHNDALIGNITGSAISLGASQFRNNRLSFYAHDNMVALGYSFDNESQQATRAEIILSGELSRDAGDLAVLARALPSNIYYEGDGWSLSSGDISYSRGNIKIDRLTAVHEDEQLLIDGGYSQTQEDTLNVVMDKFRLDLLNTVLRGKNIPTVEGRATGRATVLSAGTSMAGLLAGIQCDSTYIGGKRMGQLSLSSVWNEEAQRFDATMSNRLDGRNTLHAEASLVPSSKELQALLRMNQFNLGYIESMLTDLFYDFEGSLSGEISARGPLQDLHVQSHNLKLDNGVLTLDFTRVPYLAHGDLALDDKGLHFTDIRLKDRENGSGKITGGILFDGLRNIQNMRMDLHLGLNSIQALDLPFGANSLMYGTVYASGRVDVTGPMEKMLLSIDASNAKEGNIHLLTGGSGTDRSRELLTFTKAMDENMLDPYEQMLSSNRKTTAKSSNLITKMRIRATPELTAYLSLSEENTIVGQGNGTIELESNSIQDSFSLGGDYTLSGGSLHFSVMNLVTRNFSLKEGSTVRFNGDVDETDLNVTGVYTTKGNLSNLLPSYETANQVGRRTVNCEVNVTGKLKNPEVGFQIDIPDLDPLVKSQVDAALNSEDKVQKQFIYLLLAGNFLPTEESGITTNGTDVLVSNMSSIMTDQLNNIFSKLNIPLDLGLNYQSTQSGTNLFDVAVSTQLFNNRVIVNGTVGNKQVVGGTTTNEVAGDIDIEIKLNRSGSLRLNVFSHSADAYTYYLDNSQRNGAGIAYQREFNSFRQFFRELFSSRRRREERAMENAARGTRQQILQIDSTGKSTIVHEVR